ncbi:MAG: hypothetical protein ABI480_13750 [Chitinophagaceae bacterium]
MPPQLLLAFCYLLFPVPENNIQPITKLLPVVMATRRATLVLTAANAAIAAMAVPVENVPALKQPHQEVHHRNNQDNVRPLQKKAHVVPELREAAVIAGSMKTKS